MLTASLTEITPTWVLGGFLCMEVVGFCSCWLPSEGSCFRQTSRKSSQQTSSYVAVGDVFWTHVAVPWDMWMNEDLQHFQHICAHKVRRLFSQKHLHFCPIKRRPLLCCRSNCSCCKENFCVYGIKSDRWRPIFMVWCTFKHLMSLATFA